MALKTATRRTQLVCDGDGCDKSIQLGDKWYSCVECDFDICESCVSSPVAPPTSPEPTRRRRSAASPTAPDSVERSIHSPGLIRPQHLILLPGTASPDQPGVAIAARQPGVVIIN